MCIQPKDGIKEPPAHLIRRVNYKEHDKSTTEGPYKNTERQIPSGLSSETYSCLWSPNVIQGINIRWSKRERFLECECIIKYFCHF